jgi:hypothetical protein
MQGVPWGQHGPMAGCGAVHLGDALAGPHIFPTLPPQAAYE